MDEIKPDQKVQEQTQAEAAEAAILGMEMGEILVSPKPDVVRLSHLVKRLKEIGDKHRKDVFKEIRKKTKDHPHHPAVTQLDGPPSRRFAITLKSLKDAEHRLSGEELAKLQQSQKDLADVMRMASIRYRSTVHMSVIGAPLADPRLIGDHIERYAKIPHAPEGTMFTDLLGADLSNRNLDGVELVGVFLDGANLTAASLIGIDLHDSTLAEANLTNADLSNANLSGVNFGGATLRNTKMTGANLKGAIFDKAIIDGADMQGADMEETSFIATQFIKGNFSKANLTKSKWLGIHLNPDLEKFSNTHAPHIDDAIDAMQIGAIDFTEADLSFAFMLGCHAKDGIQMQKVNLARASLQRCYFNSADFSGAQFISTNVVLGTTMSKSNFQGATITASFFRGANISQSNFHLAKLDKSNFSLANMTNSSAIQISAAGCHFERANLTNVTFLSSKMIGAAFRNSNLTGTCFDDCDLTHADFSRAKTTESTTFINANLSRALLPQSPFKR